MAWNFIKTQASSVANALTYGLTHLDQVSTAGDIIVVQHPDGTLHSTPFNVRFGIFSVPRPQTKVVQIQVNGQMVSAVMKLRSDGSAYFLESSGRSNSGDFPISPTTGAISPPRSPTLSAASPLTIISNNSNSNNQNQNTNTNNNNAANITDVKNNNNSNNNGNDDAASSALHPEIVTVDEGSAVEIAKNNPEFRDLVTSMLGEGRETALQESFAAAANYNNNNNNNQGGGDSFVGRPNGHMRISSSSGAAAAAGGTGIASAVAEIGSGGGGGIIDEGISPVQRQATGQDTSWFVSGNGSNGVSPPGDSAITLPPGANANSNNNNNSSNAIPHVTFADNNNNNHNNSSMSLVTPLAGGGKSFASVSGGLRLSRFASSDNIAALNNLIANDDEFAAIVKEIGQQHEQLQHQQQQPLQLASASLTNDEGASSETLNASNASPSVQENSQQRQNDSTASPTSIALLDQTNNAKFSINKNSTPDIISMGQNADSPDFRHKNSNKNNKNDKEVHEVPAISQQHQQPLQLLPPSQGQHQQNPVPVSLLPPEQAGSQIIDDGDFVDDSSDDDYDYFYQPSSATANNNNKVSDATKQGGVTSTLPQLSLAGAANNNNNEGNYIDGENANNNNLEGTTTEQQEFLQNNSKKLGAASQQQQHAHHVHATTTPSHNELVKLGLKDGANIVKFIVYSTTLTRSIEVEARIFLWPYTAKVIISDIDGTVTKSDVMGHLSAILRWDWTHPGLCSLYTNIAKNEYKFLYLTARSLSQTSSTRSFLESIVQDGQRLPDGPVFTAPEKLFAALTQEVFKRSHIFKTNCLTEVRDIFPKSLRHPLYAGFGNRIGDSIAYEGVGIPLHKIFIIDESSVVHVCKVKQTYRDLAHLVDMTFPPISGKIPVHASQLPVPYTDVVVKNGQTYARSDSPVSSNGATAGSVGSFSVNNNNNNNQLPISPTLSSSALQSGRGAAPLMTGHFPNAGDGHQGSSDATRSPSSDKNNNYLMTGGQSRTNSNNNNNGLGITTTIGGSGNPVAPPLFLQSSNSNNNYNNKGSDEMMEEKVDFNEFNYWRVDPSSLVSLNRANGSAKATPAGTSTVPSVLSNNNNSATSSNSAVTSPSRPTNSSTAKGGSSLLSDAPSSINNNNTATTPRSDSSTSQPSSHDGSQQQQPVATSAGWFGSWFGRGNKTAPPPPLPPAGATATTEQQQHQSEESSQQVPALEKKPSLLSDK